ncbi:hypothetical protein HMP0721_0032 [Pseudoramibacter alactolyticus ATCC 23263]|jgi:flagellar basal body-associated protein FliL|uniref:Uncharacterized protein n=1 Tax=Pseudoramibacter alactolyticus ATCC 23263 TaxID=887929 RepID=E6MDF0_9FIRM|nr:hypothetical protein [Pseudoramibacter alactolyticus]EFV02894.1 hypothetical protein HMP0721_0032 [Pseudoramibacter alactolyticus ATCC 23263]
METKVAKKKSWKPIVLNILGIIFAVAFFYGIFYSVQSVASTVAQYKAMGTNIPGSYVVQQIISAIMNVALPSLFFSAGSFSLAYLIGKAEQGVAPAADETATEPVEAAEAVEETAADEAEKADDNEAADEAIEAEAKEDATE